jgi:NAD(P)H-binding
VFKAQATGNRAPSAGPFKLEIDGGISAYKAQRSNVLLITSAAAERNALIGDNAEARAADIPIVQLNPAGTLNWKYKGEMAVRTSGLPYTILRPTGLVGDSDPDEGKPYALELSQGDTVTGRVSRREVASVVSQSLDEPAAMNATFEVNRVQRWAVGGPVFFSGEVPKSEFLRLVAGVWLHRHASVLLLLLCGLSWLHSGSRATC